MKTQLREIDFSLKQQCEALSSRNQELGEEIDRWKLRYKAIEAKEAKEIENVRTAMENQRKSSIEREIKEAAIRFQNERAKLESEVRKNR